MSIIPYRSGFAKLSCQPDRRPLDGSVPSFARPYQRQSKSKAKCTHGCSAFSLACCRSPTDAKRPDAFALRALPQGCASRRAAVSLQLAGHPRCGCLHALQDVMHVFTAQLAFSLCRSRPGFVKSSSLAHGHRCSALGCPVALAHPQTRQSFSWLLNRIASLRPARPQVA